MKNYEKFLDAGGFGCVEHIDPMIQYQQAIHAAEKMGIVIDRFGKGGMVGVDHGGGKETRILRYAVDDVGIDCPVFRHEKNGEVVDCIEQRAVKINDGEIREVPDGTERLIKEVMNDIDVWFIVEDMMTGDDVWGYVLRELSGKKNPGRYELNKYSGIVSSLIIGTRNMIFEGKEKGHIKEELYTVLCTRGINGILDDERWDGVIDRVDYSGKDRSTSLPGAVDWFLKHIEYLGGKLVVPVCIRDRIRAAPISVAQSRVLLNDYGQDFEKLLMEKPITYKKLVESGTLKYLYRGNSLWRGDII